MTVETYGPKKESRKLRAIKKRKRLEEATAEASKIDELIDEEKGDIYSIKRLERQFEEAKTHQKTPSFANNSFRNARDL